MLQQQLLRREGVVGVAINPLTASVLVEYELLASVNEPATMLGWEPGSLSAPADTSPRSLQASERTGLELGWALAELALACVTRRDITVILEWCVSWVMRWAVECLQARERASHRWWLSSNGLNPLPLPHLRSSGNLAAVKQVLSSAAVYPGAKVQLPAELSR